MKNNNNLKICFVLAMLFLVCSIEAQSIQQRFQKDMEQRKNHVNAVRLKAKEQQVQQQAERANNTIDNKPTTDARQNQTGNAPTSTRKEGVVPATKSSTGAMRQPKRSATSRG